MITYTCLAISSQPIARPTGAVITTRLVVTYLLTVTIVTPFSTLINICNMIDTESLHTDMSYSTSV